jgi:Fe-Mn family superoxide dismutase
MKVHELLEWGRIVKGVNTTVDVGPNEIKIQAAKFGNTVDKDGHPPTLSKKVKGKSTNVLYNLGLTESKKTLVLEKLPYSKDGLNPVMSKETIDYHYGKLAAGYVKRYNAKEGNAKFNEAGAFLHNIFFPQMMEPKGSNKPSGASEELINKKYKSFDKFKEKFEKVAMGIQGSGWVYMSTTGEIKTIVNHEVKNDIALLVDWWEHAWALDYQSDKGKYLNNIWRIINWDVVNERLK